MVAPVVTFIPLQAMVVRVTAADGTQLYIATNDAIITVRLVLGTDGPSIQNIIVLEESLKFMAPGEGLYSGASLSLFHDPLNQAKTYLVFSEGELSCPHRIYLTMGPWQVPLPRSECWTSPQLQAQPPLMPSPSTLLWGHET